MKKKALLISLILLAGLLVLSGCTSNTEPAATATAEPTATTEPTATAKPAATAEPEATAAPGADASGELVLTPEELAQYNGQDGNPAYIAVDGVIYDVTNVPQWRNGLHNGFTAGNVLTEEIKTISPHGVSKLNGVPVVGKLAD